MEKITIETKKINGNEAIIIEKDNLKLISIKIFFDDYDVMGHKRLFEEFCPDVKVLKDNYKPEQYNDDYDEFSLLEYEGEKYIGWSQDIDDMSSVTVGLYPFENNVFNPDSHFQVFNQFDKGHENSLNKIIGIQYTILKSDDYIIIYSSDKRAIIDEKFIDFSEDDITPQVLQVLKDFNVKDLNEKEKLKLNKPLEWWEERYALVIDEEKYLFNLDEKVIEYSESYKFQNLSNKDVEEFGKVLYSVIYSIKHFED